MGFLGAEVDRNMGMAANSTQDSLQVPFPPLPCISFAFLGIKTLILLKGTETKQKGNVNDLSYKMVHTLTFRKSKTFEKGFQSGAQTSDSSRLFESF